MPRKTSVSLSDLRASVIKFQRVIYRCGVSNLDCKLLRKDPGSESQATGVLTRLALQSEIKQQNYINSAQSTHPIPLLIH
jgi:hypothetical protein